MDTVSPSPSKCPMSLVLLCSEVLAGMVVAGQASWQCLHIPYTIPLQQQALKGGVLDGLVTALSFLL